MNTKKRVALVGCGTVSRNHLHALRSVEGICVCALCDIHMDRVQKARDSFFPQAHVYTDFDTMLSEEDLYAIHICTPHYLHTPMTVAALTRGIHVFLEKPMAITKEELDRLEAAERTGGGRVCVCFQNRFSPAFLRAKELCDTDGGVLTASATLVWRRTKEYYTESGWRGQKATEGGGVMVNQAIHTIDLLCKCLGKPTEVTATCSNHHLKDVNDVEDTCEGVIRFESGKQATFYATTASAAQKDITSILLFTANHTVEIRMPYLYIDSERVEKTEDDRWFVGKSCYGSGHACLIPRFYEALDTKAPMPVSIQDARAAHDIFLAAYQSNDTPILIR